MSKNLRLYNNENFMRNESLYQLYKYEQISLLIFGINNWGINETSLLIFIQSLKQQTLKEIQIIFILSDEKEDKIVNLVKKCINNDKNIKIFTPSESNELDNYYLMNSIKGKFILIIEKLVIFEQRELENLFLLIL